jgi:hypothetical protein
MATKRRSTRKKTTSSKSRARSGGATRGTKNNKRTVLSPGKSKTAARRKGSFLVRHFAPKSRAPLKTKSGKPTPHALGAKRWGEPIPKSKSAEARLYRKGKAMLRAAKKK